MIFDPHRGEPSQTQDRPRFATGLMRPDAFCHRIRSGTTLLAAILALGCADSVAAVRDGPTPAALKVEQLTTALAARFTYPERSGEFETARRRLVSGALNPSDAYRDTAIWSSVIPPATRVLIARGSLTARGYRFEIAPLKPALVDLGDTRHTITLRRIAGDEYQWSTGVDFAMGSITAADIAGMLEQLLSAAHQRDPLLVRTGARAALPRSTAVMSRLFAIDSMSLRPGPLGTTTVNLLVTIHTERLAKTAPHFAEYLRKYVDNSRFRFSLADKAGALYFEAVGGDKKIAIRYRVNAGTIVSFLGPPRPLPDSLRLTTDLLMRVKMFDVGWRNLVTDFTIDRTDRSRSWLIVARTEPEWHLPLITARLLRSPLRRPFQGPGASFEAAVIDSAGGLSIMARRAHLEVKESAILRFMSSLVSRIFDDLDAAVEREEAAFVRELMAAFQADARGVLSK
jgi:hypothetical protein